MTFKGSDRMLRQADPVVKTTDVKPVGEEQYWICIRRCTLRGAGEWESGDRVFDPQLINLVKGHPNFRPVYKEHNRGG